MLILAKQLGGIEYLSPAKVKELLKLRAAWGFEDPKHNLDLTPQQMCEPINFGSTWNKSGLKRTAFRAHPTSNERQGSSSDLERPKQQVELSDDAMEELASRIVKKLKDQS